MESILVPSIVKKSPIVTQSNKITEARYSLTVAEQRLVLTMISMISPEDEDFKDYEIKISDFQRLLGLNSNDLYRRTEETILKLAGRVIHIKDGMDFFVSHWFSSARYFHSQGIVRLSFDKNLKPYFIQLKEQFTKYNLFTVASFKSAYTIRIYMLLKQYQNIGFREFELQELRKILGIDEKEYAEFKDFKKRVINQAKKEFEEKNKEAKGGYKSDITFDLETKRTGRKISHLKFIIKKQSYQETLPLNIPEPEEREKTPAMSELEKYGIGEAIAERYTREQGEEAVFRCVAIFEQRKTAGDIKNVGAGYLLKLLDSGAGKKTQAEQEAENQKRAKEEAKAEAERKKKEQEKKEKLEREYGKKARAEYLATLSEEEQAELLETIKQENPESSILIKDLKAGIGGAFLLAKIPDYQARKEAYLAEHLP